MSTVSKGLVIKSPWSGLILDGYKTWEIRGSRTKIRGRIAIIESGTKQIHGYADVVDCIGPLTGKQLNENVQKHRVEETFNSNIGPKFKMPYARTYAWVLDNVQRLKNPKPYVHPPGAIIWVNL
jgi:hypothetical protein